MCIRSHYHLTMLPHNCSSPGNTYILPDPSWCPESRECIMWNVSLEDLPDLCLSRNEYLLKHLGHRRSLLFMPMCIVYLLIFVVGVVGNGLTCVVIARHRVMRTPTNFYLFSLAMSDLLVLVLGLPLELYELWSNYPFLLGTGGCYFKTCLFETVCLASVLNVTCLSAERYVAVIYPLRAKHVVTRAHAKRVILALWLASFICALPNTSLHGILLLPPRFGQTFPDSAVCGLVRPAWIYNLLVQVTALLFFVLPMLTISLLYLLIGLQLRRERLTVNIKAWPEQNKIYIAQSVQQRARHRQVTKMLVVLVIVFGICWAPFHIDRVMWSYIDNWTEEHHRIFEFVHLASGIFFYLSSVVNPILYNLMSSRFREMFREVACRGTQQHSSVTQVTQRSAVYEKTAHGTRLSQDISTCM
ncbi:neuromedin-U receptor 1-like isoform X2 [Pygocentrus nattereri]|uniref:neuromedin-U receptor 1-like isoform X2 n=1 Tax=Pygocentrus nattereri TaxID=42514 RepID=UPI0018917106|nr:neuromedin-U receptor 1-like isoform X2 [Pygocentrus nattereri]